MDEKQDTTSSTITQVQSCRRRRPGLLLADFIRVITRSRLVVWSRTDDDDETAGFSAALDTGASDLEIMVRQGKAAVSWFTKDDDLVAEMEAAIAAELYAEVEESYRASGSLARDREVAVIRKGAALTTRPYHTHLVLACRRQRFS